LLGRFRNGYGSGVNFRLGCRRRSRPGGWCNNGGRRRGWRSRRRWRLHHDGDRWRRDRDGWTWRGRTSPGGGRTGDDYRSRGRTRSNGRSCRGRRGNNGRSLARLGHNLARLRPGCNRRRGSRTWRSWRWSCGSGRGGRRRTHHNGGRSRRSGGCGPLRILCCAFCFLLAGQNGLHHIAGLGDVGEVNLGLGFLLGSRRGRRCRPHSALQKSTDLLSLTCFDGA